MKNWDELGQICHLMDIIMGVTISNNQHIAYRNFNIENGMTNFYSSDSYILHAGFEIKQQKYSFEVNHRGYRILRRIYRLKANEVHRDVTHYTAMSFQTYIIVSDTYNIEGILSMVSSDIYIWSL